MKLIVGLGNPGSKYLFTRHNLGFMLIDAFAEDSPLQKKHNSLIQKIQIQEQITLLAKPQTFMNLSGRAVKEIMNFYKIPLENLLVIHDDKDQIFGNMKFQKSRGHGGHNGIKNIHKELNTNDYTRLKLGVGLNQQTSGEINTPSINVGPAYFITGSGDPGESEDSTSLVKKDTVDYVLSPFNKKEKEKLPDFLKRALKAVHCFVQNGYEESANQFNSNKF